MTKIGLLEPARPSEAVDAVFTSVCRVIPASSVVVSIERANAGSCDLAVAADVADGNAIARLLEAEVPFAFAPLLRDDARARERDVRAAVHRARSLIFSSDAEAALALALYGPGVLHKSYNAESLTAALGLDGRVDTSAQPAIAQVLQTLEYADAISNYALHVQSILREHGFRSEIFAESISPRMHGHGFPFDRARVGRSDAIIYHHAIGSDLTQIVAELPVPTAAIYHNITPPEFFRPYNPTFADLLARGRTELAADLRGFDHLVGDSSFNAADLAAAGLKDASVIPVIVDFAHFDTLPEAPPAAPSDVSQWLFVGRIAPNKGLKRLLRALDAHVCADPNVHLTLVGRYDVADPFYAELRAIVEVRGLAKHVTFAGVLTDAQLLGVYERSDCYLSLSEHEGFCVPLVEAMYFDLPIIAAATTAVPETLGAAGLLVDGDAGSPEIAALAMLVHSDPDLRRRLIEVQRARRKAFTPEAVSSKVLALAAVLTNGAASNDRETAIP